MGNTPGLGSGSDETCLDTKPWREKAGGLAPEGVTEGEMFGLACSGAKTDTRLRFPCKPVCNAGGGFGAGAALKGGVTNPGLLSESWLV
mmetsp:Transcript_18645/g.28370  ORF Transcript_18645/g.28370 Transcript_18645/m.28370 type:complete len:89 (-) Transcript_18645:1900-2166(-)